MRSFRFVSALLAGSLLAGCPVPGGPGGSGDGSTGSGAGLVACEPFCSKYVSANCALSSNKQECLSACDQANAHNATMPAFCQEAWKTYDQCLRAQSSLGCWNGKLDQMPCRSEFDHYQNYCLYNRTPDYPCSHIEYWDRVCTDSSRPVSLLCQGGVPAGCAVGGTSNNADLYCCPASALPGPDAGSAGPDAAEPGLDAAEPGPDAAISEPDAGEPGADAAVSEPPDAAVVILPAVTGIVPTRAFTGVGAVPVTFSGRKLAGPWTVHAGSYTVTATGTDTSLSVTLPAPTTAAAGTVKLWLEGLGGFTTNAIDFPVVAGPTQIASIDLASAHSIRSLAADEDFAYYAVYKSGGFDLRRVPLAGGEAETILTLGSSVFGVWGLWVAGGYLLYPEDTGIRRIALTSPLGPSEQLVAIPEEVRGLVTDGTYLYYLVVTGSQCELRRVAVAGGAPEVLCSNIEQGSGDLSMVLDDENVYLSFGFETGTYGPGSILVIPKVGGAATQPFEKDFVFSLALNGGDLFYTASTTAIVQPSLVKRVPKAGGAATTVFSQNAGKLFGASMGTLFHVSHKDGGALWASSAYTPAAPVLLAPEPVVGKVVFTSDKLVFTASLGGNVDYDRLLVAPKAHFPDLWGVDPYGARVGDPDTTLLVELVGGTRSTSAVVYADGSPLQTSWYAGDTLNAILPAAMQTDPRTWNISVGQEGFYSRSQEFIVAP